MTARIAPVAQGQQEWVAPHAELLQAAIAAIQALAVRARWAVWRWYQVRRTSEQVAGLQDHLLADIGLSRTSLLSATMRRVREEEAFRRRHGS
jgi:uncharacterized protein YjiS (DUF1127 family)